MRPVVLLLLVDSVLRRVVRVLARGTDPRVPTGKAKLYAEVHSKVLVEVAGRWKKSAELA